MKCFARCQSYVRDSFGVDRKNNNVFKCMSRILSVPLRSLRLVGFARTFSYMTLAYNS